MWGQPQNNNNSLHKKDIFNNHTQHGHVIQPQQSDMKSAQDY